MKHRTSSGFLFLIALVMTASGVGLALQWQQTMALRSELELARLEVGEIERLRAENKRLRDKQIAASELEALRADHAALPRLRAEIEKLKKD